VSDGPAAADHLSLDELAELEEGIAANADALRRHVDGCPACRERAGQLNASRALLSTLPAEPMPADVAARIDAALAAEPAPAGRGTIVPLHTRRAWLRGPNVAAAAAGVAVLALGAALVVGHLGDKSTGGDNAAKTNGGAGGAGPLGAAAPGSGLKQFQTGHDYTEATYRGYVTGLLLTNPPPFPIPPQTPATATSTTPKSTPSPTSFTRDQLRDPATVYVCADLIAGHPVSPIAIDYATYEGVPADILVLPALDNPTGGLDIWVIRKDCGAGMTDFKFLRMPRPTTTR